ncbi:MAG: hypothetical protein Q4D54_07485 [Eubacteriales bacterium]|nr:hypothetical protein [Eubacteriales bacterium]
MNPKWVTDFVGKYRNRMNLLGIKEASKYINTSFEEGV